MITFVDFTAVSASQLNTLHQNGSPIDSCVIGGVTPAAGSFTTLTATSARFPTLTTSDSSTNAATTAFVHAAVTAGGGGISNPVTITAGTINGTTIGATTAAAGTFTTLTVSGTTSFVTQPITDNSSKAATTAFVQQLLAPAGGGAPGSIVGGTLDNCIIGGATPAAASFTTLTLTGAATGLTPAAGDNSTHLATTAFVSSALASSHTYVASSVAITGGTINGTTIGATTASSGAFTTLTASSNPLFPTPVTSDSSTKAATTAFVHALMSIAGITSGTINGASIGATTASTGVFTTLQSTGLSTLASLGVAGTSTLATANVTTLAVSGSATGVTPVTTDNSTKFATTQFVSAVVASGGTYVASNVTITGGRVDNTQIGTTTQSSGAFTTLSASGAVSGTGFSTYLASPPAIGGTVPAAGTFAGITNTSSEVSAVRIVTAAGNVTQLATDRVIIINKGIAATTAVTLLASPPNGTRITIKDGAGTAATYNITISGTGTIDGAASIILTAPYGSVDLISSGSNWSII